MCCYSNWHFCIKASRDKRVCGLIYKASEKCVCHPIPWEHISGLCGCSNLWTPFLVDWMLSLPRILWAFIPQNTHLSRWPVFTYTHSEKCMFYIYVLCEWQRPLSVQLPGWMQFFCLPRKTDILLLANQVFQFYYLHLKVAISDFFGPLWAVEQTAYPWSLQLAWQTVP